MLYNFTLLTWDANNYIIDGEPTTERVLSCDDFVEALTSLSEEDFLECRVLNLLADSDDPIELEEIMPILADNLPDMLNDGTIVVSECKEFTVKGVENRRQGIIQHKADCKRYYTDHPFI